MRERDFVILEINGREQRNLHDQLSEAFGLYDDRHGPIPRPPDATPNWDALTDIFNAASAQQKQLVIVLAGDGADFRRPPAAAGGDDRQ